MTCDHSQCPPRPHQAADCPGEDMTDHVLCSHTLPPPAPGHCRCWEHAFALGHEGHCCFLRDDRSRKINSGFREVEDICHRPPAPTITPYVPLAERTGEDHHA